MLQLPYGRIDKYGQVIISSNGLVDLLYSGENDFSMLVAEDNRETQLYNKWANIFDQDQITIYKKIEGVSVEEFDAVFQSAWLIPDKYKEIDVDSYVLSKCQTSKEIERVKEELVLFKERNMESVIRTLIYLVDVMRHNNVVWGVGRGSACSSYSLFLIGVHKVNSIKYKLDIKEFLK